MPERSHDRHAEVLKSSCCSHGHEGDHPAVETRVKDPVCGMTVNPETAKHRMDYRGETYYFCRAGCREKFEADPERYLNPQPAPAAEEVPEGTIYTCPMHPEIRQAGPGSCPICGMALEPELVTADAAPNPELIDMTRRFWIGAALTLPVLALEMGGHLTSLHMILGQQLSNWVQFLFATPVVLWAGWPLLVRGWQSIRTRNLNMFTLIAMGTGVAWLYSLVATALPGAFPPAFRGPEGAVAIYFEAASVITVLVLLGQVLELKARERTSGAIRAFAPMLREQWILASPMHPLCADECLGLCARCGKDLKCRSMSLWCGADGGPVPSAARLEIEDE
ncbi:MAG: YHS domain-containing protein [Rhodomicrobium sp.]|nr:YHS domain-containing protein [Rhodomicrobium sp.]